MTNFVRKCQLGHFGRNSGVVVDKGDYSSVEAPLGHVGAVVDVLFVALVRLANATRGT